MRTLTKMAEAFRALSLFSYGPVTNLTLQEACLPPLRAGEVLVKIKAASINPIDSRMRQGYGRNIFGPKVNFPWTLGRDFSGEVVKNFSPESIYHPGDLVFGTASPFYSGTLQQGSHAEYIAVPEADIIHMPQNIDFIGAASLPYVALTTYTALITESGWSVDDFAGKHVFLHAGAGGVGSYTIQFLKALGAQVATTCSTQNVEFVKRLGADVVVDYSQLQFQEELADYDLVYDLLGGDYMRVSTSILRQQNLSQIDIEAANAGYQRALEMQSKAEDDWGIPQHKAVLNVFDDAASAFINHSCPTYVSIVGPLMLLTDQHGLKDGLKRYIQHVLSEKLEQAKLGRRFNYSVFKPNREGLELLQQHIATGCVKPNIRSTYDLHQYENAYADAEQDHGHGKVVFSL